VSPVISTLTLTFGRVRWLECALYGLLNQDCPVEWECILVNTFPKQRLLFDHPRVKILNLDARPSSLGLARNIGVAAATGRIIRVADDDDFTLKGDLEFYVDAFAANPDCDWVLCGNQFYAEGNVIKAITPGACHQFAYTKKAWEAVNGYPALSCGEDRVLVNGITKAFKGVKITPEMPQEIYCWANQVYHASGLGPDKPGCATVHDRVGRDLEERVRCRQEPTGVITLRPKVRLDYEKLARDFMAAKKGVEPTDNRPRIFHAVEHHGTSDARKRRAQLSWDRLYAQGVVPCHLWEKNYPRTALDIGDRRKLPYLKDVLEFAMRQAGDGDIICWTNDDDWLHPELPSLLIEHVTKHGPCTSKRCEVSQAITGPVLPPQSYTQGTTPHMGRDLFAATKRWLVEHWETFPDFILGASDFDLWMAVMVRLANGVKATHQSLYAIQHPSEIPGGYVVHEIHAPGWAAPANTNDAPSQKHNRELFRQWAETNYPELKFSPLNTI
jgi:hypothetical protein